MHCPTQMLEDNQVLVQGMMANRYMATFRETILAWNKKLMSVADVVQVGRVFDTSIASRSQLKVKGTVGEAVVLPATTNLHFGALTCQVHITATLYNRCLSRSANPTGRGL